jgi:hypothetical protein
MRIVRRLSLGLIYFTLILLSTSCGIISGGVTRAASGPGATMLSRENTPLAPTAVPQSQPGEGVTGRLAGLITGLDPGDSAELALEFLDPGSLEVLRSEWLAPLSPPPGKTPGPGEVRQQFKVVNGRWGAANLSLEPGLYRLVPQARGYVHTPRSILLAVPEAGVAWRYLDMDFEFLHPGDASARLGAPICPERPPGGGVYVLPEGIPTPTPAPAHPGTSPPPRSSPEKWPPGTCYAGHFYDRKITPAGLRGQVSGLPAGQVATITLYALPPVAGEVYGTGAPPSLDRSWSHPPQITAWMVPPAIARDWPVTASLRVRTGSWGLVDPGLASRKYLVVTQAAAQTARPPAYEVVVFGGKMPGIPGGVDFAFEPYRGPIPTAQAPSGPGVADLLAHPPPPGQSVEVDAYFGGAGVPPRLYDELPGIRVGEGCPLSWDMAFSDDPSYQSVLSLLYTGLSNPLPEDASWLLAVVPEAGQPGKHVPVQFPYHVRLRGRLGDPAFAACPYAGRVFVVEAVAAVYQERRPELLLYPTPYPPPYAGAPAALPSGEYLDTAGWRRYHDPDFGVSLLYPPDWSFEPVSEPDVVKAGILQGPQWPAYPVQVRVYRGETWTDPNHRPPALRDVSLNPFQQSWLGQRSDGSEQPLAGFRTDSQVIPGERAVSVLFSSQGYTYELALRYPTGFDASQPLLTIYSAIVEGFRLDVPPSTSAQPRDGMPAPPVRQTLGRAR